MNLENLLLKGLKGIIQGGISVNDFHMVTNFDKLTCQRILDFLIENQIGTTNDNLFFFERGDKLKIVMNLLEKGFPIDELSSELDWKDFEGLTAEILTAKNFAIVKNLIMTNPRMEIDVVGIRLGIAILIDCKHWNKYSTSSLNSVVLKQIKRTKTYVQKTPGSIGVPVIVTLSQDKINFIKNVPIVPITKFSSFIDDFYGHLDEMEIIKRN